MVALSVLRSDGAFFMPYGLKCVPKYNKEIANSLYYRRLAISVVIRAGVKAHFRCFTLVYTRCNSADYA